MPRREHVDEVLDGDSFTTGNRKNAVRLAGIDGLEKGEPGAAAVARKLGSLIEDREVTIDTLARDSYGRAVANVKVIGKSVNKAMKEFLDRM